MRRVTTLLCAYSSAVSAPLVTTATASGEETLYPPRCCSDSVYRHVSSETGGLQGRCCCPDVDAPVSVAVDVAGGEDTWVQALLYGGYRRDGHDSSEWGRLLETLTM